MMLNFDVMPGDTIEYVVGRMIDIARIDNQSVTTSFNDIKVTVDASSNAIDIVNKFLDDINERHKAWLNSVDGIRALCAAEEHRRNLQHRCDVLLAKLDTLDFSDDASILSWLCELADCAHVDVDSKSRKVLAKFKHEGYHADVNCGEHFNGEDRENFMRYIVGQAISGIAAVGSPHGVIHKFVEEWRQKFLCSKDSPHSPIGRGNVLKTRTVPVRIRLWAPELRGTIMWSQVYVDWQPEEMLDTVRSLFRLLYAEQFGHRPLWC